MKLNILRQQAQAQAQQVQQAQQAQALAQAQAQAQQVQQAQQAQQPFNQNSQLGQQQNLQLPQILTQNLANLTSTSSNPGNGLLNTTSLPLTLNLAGGLKMNANASASGGSSGNSNNSGGNSVGAIAGGLNGFGAMNGLNGFSIAGSGSPGLLGMSSVGNGVHLGNFPLNLSGVQPLSTTPTILNKTPVNIGNSNSQQLQLPTFQTVFNLSASPASFMHGTPPITGQKQNNGTYN